ncbi:MULTISPECIES: hypothetical protein [Mycobacterium]|uniref:Uncharacterized protein n=1 Tax=Mycobacterium kiyosense TaxID=2871094 RepID=A0A9P3QAA7_9MYCO|nr:MULTISPECIES: hypothetical protein [Mycobacterium]BDB44576.1 hypothetical protein IWGMT90018_50220 [Mycobacterium kiyosense]BDE16082.1 hypothetical protein MKCMC460_49420 [Mycobacterium sp. 20KCMC460]GLB85965.1 hypothetical protein SRL2020028_52210 [Mycobacterium kiyosense]GLB92691.1 hypothetical protein SRL2020130_55080 [Mycobacterium kiyosense]GLB98623.1 hypothetical protein SRL2020226_53990 [Mycobacterium kiyosense]
MAIEIAVAARASTMGAQAYALTFPDAAIGVHRPFQGTSKYVEVLERYLKRAGQSV